LLQKWMIFLLRKVSVTKYGGTHILFIILIYFEIFLYIMKKLIKFSEVSQSR
jgi:hypothetical protein